MKKVLITGSQGFISTYLCNEFINNGYKVIGIDLFCKYGPVTRPHDNHPNFKLYKCDVLSPEFAEIVSQEKPDYIIGAAASIGGIVFFNQYPYSLLANNMRITAATFDAAIKGHKEGWLNRIIMLSSSMVHENCTVYPTPENDTLKSPPPSSTYGFSKLAVEYFCQGGYQEHGLRFSVARPFNCVGCFEDEALGEKEIKSGNIKMMMSHVLPDLVNKCLKGQNPLHILGDGQQVRVFTNGRDIARGIRLVLESDQAVNETFNISANNPCKIIDLAKLVWNKINPDKSFNVIHDPAYNFDVQKRVPCTAKAERVLGFKAEVSLDQSVDEVISYIRGKLNG